MGLVELEGGKGVVVGSKMVGLVGLLPTFIDELRLKIAENIPWIRRKCLLPSLPSETMIIFICSWSHLPDFFT